MTQSSLVFPEGALCQWCKAGDATTILYGWRTCLTCVSGGPSVRVQRWLRDLGTKAERMQDGNR